MEPVSDAPDTLWRVTIETADGQQETAVFKGVVVANGTLAEPNMPSFEGHFDGELLHTSAYKSADLFKGKRVLIVGAGNSGCDIAVDAVHHAQSIDISVRRGYYFVPKYVFGKPADSLGGKRPLPPWLKQKVDSTILKWFTGDPVRFGFPKPAYKMYESHPVVNSLILYHIGHGDVHVRPDMARLDGHTVLFKDGSARDYDLILAATGYKLHYPFLDHALLNWQGMAPRCTSTSLRRASTAWPCWAWSRPAAWAGRGDTSRPSWWPGPSRRSMKAAPKPAPSRPTKPARPPISRAATNTCSSNAWRTT